MSYNLGNLPKEEMDKVNVDLAASGVAYKERMAHYREVSKRLPTGSAPVYQQMAEANGKK
ncbi:DNA polymerase III subunit theta [Serratia sp. TSA_7]|jgi:DNA polymerase-3 subunit theta|uniref:DNA polymerase III subunit theta n=1 Tax=Serratia sp. TSA_7 TaxID=3415659 RepID=UPI0040468C9C